MQVQQQSVTEMVGDVARGHYLKFVRRQKRLTLGQERKLLARSRSGERQTMETLVNANQTLVVAVSETYKDDRLSFMDRVAEGNVALISACRRFRPGLDGSFRGYCLLMIRKAIEYAYAEAAGFRIVRPKSEWYLSTAANGHDDSRQGTALVLVSQRGE
ncbi:MAG: sigma factor [bacterium]